MFVQFTVGTYDVAISNLLPRHAFIMLFDEAGEFRVRLEFVQNAGSSGTTNVVRSGDLFSVPMNIALLEPIVDLLRNERPIRVSADNIKNIFLVGAIDEPIGEGELTLPS